MGSSGNPLALSTPVTHILDNQPSRLGAQPSLNISDEQFYLTYEIEQTTLTIKKQAYARIALQFPDEMLSDAPRVFEALNKNLKPTSSMDHKEEGGTIKVVKTKPPSTQSIIAKLYILADTSYGACCVDEIAAEHVNADVVVHYGRACLSPTARIPVIHVFTQQPLPEQPRLIKEFEIYYKNRQQKIILMADVTYQKHLHDIMTALQLRNFSNLFLADIIHDASSPLPNRTVPEEIKADISKLSEWQLFHIAEPPQSLLLILASRVGSIRIFPTSGTHRDDNGEPFVASTGRALNRRYALLTSINTAAIIGILINTLSVKNYLHIVEHVKSRIRTAGKKSYTFVVGKINAAKVANFSEVGAWVVIGCWESSLIDSKEFWRPLLTPFELDLALKRDEDRIWTGEWNSDFQEMLNEPNTESAQARIPNVNGDAAQVRDTEGDYDSGSESAPPEFDLRTGRYVSNSRPMRSSVTLTENSPATKQRLEKSLVERVTSELAVVGGEFSPGAEHLRSKRTWKGLGSDFEIAYEETGTAVEQGSGGIARGYTHGTASETRI